LLFAPLEAIVVSYLKFINECDNDDEEDANPLTVNEQSPLFIYTYAYREEEQSLCRLEMRSFFGEDTEASLIASPIEVHPDRSPFLKERIEVIYASEQLDEVVELAKQIHMGDATFKVIFVKTNDLDAADKWDYDRQRGIERDIGLSIEGEADVHRPDVTYGLVTLGGRWYLGYYTKSKAIWLDHMKKPQNYSIALSTRVARAVANIAVPKIEGVKVIDPCCGIGTVLVEALSMGIDIEGSDYNPFIAKGARDNVAHFGYVTDVAFSDIADITNHYDVAIMDMPYNHFSTSTPEAQFSLLQQARRVADKAVIITVDTIDEMIADAGFVIRDRGIVRKSHFIRQVIVCE
jgi:tRNA G10  N-methylase Trm11